MAMLRDARMRLIFLSFKLDWEETELAEIKSLPNYL